MNVALDTSWDESTPWTRARAGATTEARRASGKSILTTDALLSDGWSKDKERLQSGGFIGVQYINIPSLFFLALRRDSGDLMSARRRP